MGGAEQITVQTANLLVNHNHSVTLCTILPWEETPLSRKIDSKVNRTSIDRKNKWSVLTMFKLRSLMRNYEVIHVHSSHNLRYVQLVNLLFILNKTIVYHEHSGNAINNPLPKYLRLLYFNNIIYLANNLRLLKHIQNNWKLNPLKTVYIPNPVRKPNHTIDFPHRESLTIGMLGNLLPVKNYEFAIELFNHLNLPNSKLLIIGNKYNEEYYQKIKRLADSSKQPVEIITNCDDSYKVIPEFDVAWHTSNSESGPLVLGEYMAHRIPFLCYNTGEIADQVKKIHPELVLNNYETSSWSSAFKKLLEEKNSYGITLYQLYLNHYTEDQYFFKCLEAYQKSLSY